MAGRCKLPAVDLTPGQRVILETLSGSRAAPVREVERARILLHYHDGKNPSAIQKALKISRVTIYHCLHKALAMGMEAGLKDAFHRPKERSLALLTRLGWCIWLAPSPKTSATLPNCGRVKAWRPMCARKRRPPAMLAWLA